MSTVSTKHPLYKNATYTWRSVSDAIAGTDAVKRANVMYLPMPLGYEVDSTAPSDSGEPEAVMNPNAVGSVDNGYLKENAPFWHSNPAYRAYLQRARFPDVTLNTLRGLVGVATRKELDVTLPASIAYMEKSATKKGQSLEELFVICLVAVLSGGRTTLIVDVNADENTVSIVPYTTQSFINWRDDEITGENTLSVFHEMQSDMSGADEFSTEAVNTHLVYSIGTLDQVLVNADGVEESVFGKVVVRKFIDDDETASTASIPNLQGTEFDGIPIVTIGSLVNENTPSPVPLAGISEIAYTIYRKGADLTNAEYMTCNPMFTITGASSASGVPVSFGSTSALILEDPEAKAFFPETDTSALDHMQTSLDKLFEEVANSGASLLGASKKMAESTDTVKVRQGAQGATLVTVVDNVAKGIQDALGIAAQVSGGNSTDVVFEASTDFAERTLDAQMLTALVGAWQNGVYSKESLIALLIESGFARGEVEDELSRIFTEAPSSASGDD